MAPSTPQIEPYRLGAMIDLPYTGGWNTVFIEGIQATLDNAHAEGVIDRPVEIILRDYVSQPYTDGSNNIDIFRDLVHNEKVLGVIGPLTTDNALAVLPEVERLAVPLLSICGTQLYVGDYAFNLSNGGMGDEPAVMAAWLKGAGLTRVGIIREEPSQIGEEYTKYFRIAAGMNGISIMLEVSCSPIDEAEQLIAPLRQLKETGVDALVYWGLGLTGWRINPALKALDWDPPRIMGTAFIKAERDEHAARDLDGWIGIGQYDERNTLLQQGMDIWEKQTGQRPVASCQAGLAYDIGRVFALGLSRMRIATPEGLRGALETIRRLPSANGAPGTVITFGPQDHRGFKGADFLVLRRAINGTTEFIGTAPVA